MERNYQETIERKQKEHGNKFISDDLNKSFIPYYENGQRITVSFRNKDGKEYEQKRGTIGITTGWKPCFLLMLTKKSLGSSYTIHKNDIVI